ncbi:hypothetical protein [Methylobacterium sp. CM6246]
MLSEIAQASPQGARRVQGRIQIVLDFLLDQPRSGRLTSLKNLRRIAVRPTRISFSTRLPKTKSSSSESAMVPVPPPRCRERRDARSGRSGVQI